MPDIIFKPNCDLSYPQLKIESVQSDLTYATVLSSLTLDSQQAVLNVMTANILFTGQTVDVLIRAEDAAVDSDNLLITISFETDELP